MKKGKDPPKINKIKEAMMMIKKPMKNKKSMSKGKK